MNGIQVTNGANIKTAFDNDFVLNTKFLGGMKISEVKVFIPNRDATKTSINNYFQIQYAHNLGYIPAVIAGQNGYQSVGWQNDATVNISANADNKYVYLVSDYFQPTTAITLIIFAEQVA